MSSLKGQSRDSRAVCPAVGVSGKAALTPPGWAGLLGGKRQWRGAPAPPASSPPEVHRASSMPTPQMWSPAKAHVAQLSSQAQYHPPSPGQGALEGTSRAPSSRALSMVGIPQGQG